MPAPEAEPFLEKRGLSDHRAELVREGAERGDPRAEALLAEERAEWNDDAREDIEFSEVGIDGALMGCGTGMVEPIEYME